MRAERIILAGLFALLAGSPLAVADDIFFEFSASGSNYAIPTPAPEGEASCALLIGGRKKPGFAASLLVLLLTSKGEALIPQLGIGMGVQPGCDIFPNSPSGKRISLDPTPGDFFFDLTFEVHAHPGAECTKSGKAQGGVVVMGTAAVKEINVKTMCGGDASKED